MNGRIVSSNEKDLIAKEFIARVNPYSSQEDSEIIDLRAYARYLADNQLEGKMIPADTANRFIVPKTI